MTPATHAVVGAVAATRVRNFGLALAASFALHFVLDAIYHFEAFYELSVPGRWTYQQTMAVLFAALTVPGLAAMVWIWRRNRQVWLFSCYALVMCGVAFEQRWEWKLAWATLLTAIWLPLVSTPLARRWVLCGFVGYLPDCLKFPFPALHSLHVAAHYRAAHNLGDWLSLLGRGRWEIPFNSRALDPYYQIGYGLTMLLEAAILCGCLYWLVRRLSVTDLAAVDHQADSVDEGSLVRK
jgi:hypothetical protein